MKSYQVKESALIKAPTEQVYRIIADYRNGHPTILPKPYFLNMEVEEGGFGAGTIVRFQMRVLGQTQNFRAIVTEPEPGRVLVETDLISGTVTTFIINPVEAEQATQVTFDTAMPLHEGIAGQIERLLVTWFLPGIYKKELALLDTVAQERTRLASTDRA